MRIDQDVYKLMDRDTKVLVREISTWISRRENMNERRLKDGTLLGIKDKPQPGKFKKMDNSILVAAVDKIVELSIKAYKEPIETSPSLELER